MSLILFSCRKSKTNNAVKIVTRKPLRFWPFADVMLTEPLFLWVLRLDNQVGPAGSTLAKPMLTLPSHLLLHVHRNVFQEDWLRYFPRSGVCTSFFHSLQILNPVSGSWQPMLPLIITCPPSSSLACEQQIQLCILSGWPILYLYQQIISDALQKSSQLLVSCHVALPADIRAIIVPCENEGLTQRLPQVV